jgi:hypothetical protein
MQAENGRENDENGQTTRIVRDAMVDAVTRQSERDIRLDSISGVNCHD